MPVFLKSTFRNLWRNKGYSFLNMAGLAIGITCAALIFLWVENEMSYDREYAKRDNLYLVEVNNDIDGGFFTHSSTPGLLAATAKTEISGVANTCRMTEGGTSLLFTAGTKTLYLSGKYADSSAFSMFGFRFREGNAKNAFAQLHNIIITSKTAHKLFGDEKNVVGKPVLIDNTHTYVVSGVIEDLSENSSLRFDWIAPFEIYRADNPWLDKWDNFGVTTYVELQPGSQLEAVNRQMHDFISRKQGASASNVHPFLFNMNKWHLYDDFKNGKPTGEGRIVYVKLFSVIAWIILLVACINFMNLSTARSEKRAKEVGVRKVLGSGKRKLLLQFFGEALLMSLLATLVAVLLIYLTLPFFNTLVQKQLQLQLTGPLHITVLLSITLVCGLVAGSYPALYLSSFNPVTVLKSIRVKNSSAAFIRKGLVVAQFVVSIVLIIATVIVYQQIQFVRNRNIGYDKNNLLRIPVRGNMVRDFSAIKQDLLSSNLVQDAALADHETITAGNNTTELYWQGKIPGSRTVISQRFVSSEFLSTIGMKLVKGRDFRSTDLFQIGDQGQFIDSVKAMNVIVTESMEKLMGPGDAIGKTIQMPDNRRGFTLNIVGVVKDYVYGDMYGQSSPVVFFNITQPATLLYVRLKPTARTEAAIGLIENVIKQHNPEFPFEYRFVDEQFNNLFLNEVLAGKLARIFAVLAIIISCLGLFGLAAYTAERRTKEISIRKVLGAKISGIVVLLSKDYLVLVGIACLIAFPLAFWMMHSWLQNYQYRTTIHWWIFVAAAVSTMAIALLTVSFQSVKAAVADPAENLRND